MLTDCRGCTMANAAVEIAEADHPARRFIEERKAAYRVRLTALCAAAGAAQADLLADGLDAALAREPDHTEVCEEELAQRTASHIS